MTTDELGWGLEEMAGDGESSIQLTDLGTAPTIFASGVEVEVGDGLAHLTFWDRVRGTGEALDRRVVVRVPMPYEAARGLASKLRKRLPTRGH